MAKEYSKEFGERIKDIRNALRISQKELAAGLDIAACNLSEIENGKVTPGYTFLFKISSRFHVSLDYLFSGEGKMFLPFDPNSARDKNRIPEQIKSIDDLERVASRSPMFRNYILAIAAKFRYENGPLLEKDVELNMESKNP
jgi:transcriptional regulator with XRE-family HTH domain